MDIQKRNELAMVIYRAHMVPGCDLETLADDSLMAANVFMESAEKFDALVEKRKAAAAAYQKTAADNFNARAEALLNSVKERRASANNEFDPVGHFIESVLMGAAAQQPRG